MPRAAGSRLRLRAAGMVRTLELSCDPTMTDKLVQQVQARAGILGISVQRGASVQPPGDVVRVHAQRDAMLSLMHDFQARADLSPSTILLSSPTGVVAPGQDAALERQSVDAAWEESMMLVRRETNARHGYLALMMLAGFVAAVGLWTDTLHLVVGAMVIAPGFQPLVRLPLGIVGQKATMATSAFRSAALGYLSLVVGAGVGWLILDAMGDVDLAGLTWANYWSTTTTTGTMLAFVAGAAGVFSIAAQRSVLSAGAMIALALVPSAALIPMAAMAGEADMAAGAATRWIVDVVGVTIAGFVVLGGKRLFVQRRPAS